jgi:hypothetical protein
VPTPEQTSPGNSSPATLPTTKQLAHMRGAVAVAVGGKDCVVCQNDDGRFVTTERHCLDVGGQVVEKFYGPCPVASPQGIAANDDDLVVCSANGKEFHTTAENCRAWDGSILRRASSKTTPT